MRIYLLIILFVLLITPFSLGAIVEGKLYDFSLNKVKDVKVEVNSIPAQRIISTDGSYSLELPKGYYTINVFSLKGDLLGKENIEIKEEGTYNLDIILFPELNNDLDINDTFNPDLNNINSNVSFYLILVILIILSVLFIYFERKKKILVSSEILNDDPLLDKVLEIIKKESKINQKDLRKHFPLSEAKISLVISELEAKGRIEKIKKGRGNILVFKK